MGVKAFTFKSPGIFLNEIDQSQLAQEPAPVGPIIVGRAQRGPAMRPVTVASYEEFVATFGEPVAGLDSSGDIWRSGTPAGPTYGPYAAQAWLANNPTVTYIRLLGTQTANPTATSDNNAGKAGWTVGGPSPSAARGAYGLFIFPSSSESSQILHGSLAAVWYCTGSVPVLSGTVFGQASTTTQRNNGLAIMSDVSGVFTVYMSGTSGAGVDTNLNKSFDFKPTSDKFVRKVFNTNPQNANRDANSGPGTTSTSFYGYWLGETFENDIAYNVFSGSNYPLQGTNGVATTSVGIILPIRFEDRLGYYPSESTAARTGWIIGQASPGIVPDFDARNQKKLFRFIALDAGDWIRNNLKVTINNITAPQNNAQKFGTFDVEIRRVSDTDSNKVLIESYASCTLDPDSPNYIARRIGDTYYSWDEENRTLNSIGDNPNKSNFVRVEMATDYTPIAGDIPFGILGPLRYDAVRSTTTLTVNGGGGYVYGTSSCFAATSSNNLTASAGTSGQSFNFRFPNSRARVSSSEDSLTTYKLADWGATTTRTPSSILYNDNINDILRLPLTGATNFTNGTEGSGLSYAWYFSLDDVRITGSEYVSGSWQNKYFVWTVQSKATSGINGSYTAVSGTFAGLLNTEGVNSFTTTFQGGIDGFNVFEGEPLRNNLMSSATDQNSYVYYTYRRAIDTVRDPEVAEGNIFSIPGLVYEPLTEYAIQMAESRGDVLAVIDASSGANNLATYITKQEKSDNAQQSTSRVATVDNVVSRMKDRNLNSSYGATYYPWVQISDSTTGKVIPVPPSIVAIGAMSYTDTVQAPWFAPAGFNRGGLSTGNAGVNVVNIVKKLSQADRDKLYPVNVNPIASFPNEGIVIFGQKTLQAVPSALDRINVRRLMIYIKRGINIISKQILFEPNVETTWNNFKDRADPFLADVKSRFGLTDYRLILDSTTTTPDLIDQNIMYAKIYLKPARAIEFIAIDFFITKTGAAFPV